MRKLSSLLLFIGFVNIIACLNNGLALTPIMGWNSWNHFGCDIASINETMFMQMADAMVSTGMSKVGYEYINMDDCWLATERDPVTQELVPDPERFPNGIQYLADYVHSLGLKFGIYEDLGTQTCMGFPGSQSYYELDIKTFASWGVDLIKMDGCNFPEPDMHAAYGNLSEIVLSTGRPMVYLCSWPTYAYVQNISVPFEYVASICNIWREFQDIRDNFDEWTAILDEMEVMKPERSQFSGPGAWNDADMLEIGNGNQTNTEYRSMFSMWAMIASPLIAGNDLRSMDQETLDILTNADVISVSQDSLGVQGNRIQKNDTLEVWSRTLSNNSIAVALFNRGLIDSEISFTADLLDLPSTQSYSISDLWTHTDNGTFTDFFSAIVPSHGTVMLKLSPSSDHVTFTIL